MKRFVLILYSLLIVLSASAEIKYIFYFIGDGMGTNQVLSAEMYRSAIQGEPLGRVQTLMTTFPYSGHASTFSKSNGITDSAAAGTCLATGSKTTNGTLGLDADGNRLGRGKGYYDRFLALVPDAYKIGVCFPFQKFPAVPVDDNDVKMDIII